MTSGLPSKALFDRRHIADGVPPPPSNLACSPHVRPPLRLSFTLVPDVMGCAGPVSMQSTPRTARATWSRSIDRQHARGARTRGPARKGGRHRQVWDVSTATHRHVRQPEALIDQFMESLSDVHVPGSPLLMACSRSVWGQRPVLPAASTPCMGGLLCAPSGEVGRRGNFCLLCVFLPSSGGEEAA